MLRFSVSRSIAVVCAALCLLLLTASSATLRAQDLPDVAQGLQPYASYHGGEVDNISTVNGGLTLHIPLLSYPQKGSLSLSYSLVFSSYSYQDVETCPTGQGGPHDGGPIGHCTHRMQLTSMGFGSSVTPGPQIDQALSLGVAAAPEPNVGTDAPLYARFYVISPDGGQHPLGAASDGYRSLDESGYLAVPSTPLSALTVSTTTPMGGATGTITDSHGIVYTTGSGSTLETIADPDGNVITVFTGEAVTDSAGRSIPVPTGNSTNTANCPNLNAPFQPLVSAALWTPPGSGTGYLFCYATVNIHTHTVAGASGNGSVQLIETEQVLQSIVLPNGTYWGFEYDSNDPSSNPGPAGAGPNFTNGLAQLNKLIFPTGGWITYTYELQLGGACDQARAKGSQPQTITTYIPQVSTRTMFDANGTQLGTWTYGIAGAGVAPFGTSDFYSGTTITSPTGDVTQVFFQNDGLMQADGTSCGVLNAGQDVYQGAPGSGTLLKSTRILNSQTAAGGFPPASTNRVLSTTTTLDDGSSSTVTKAYSGLLPMSGIDCNYNGYSCVTDAPQPVVFGGPTSTSYTGFDGTVLKQENTSYQWQTNPTYLTANLLDIPATQQDLDGSSNILETTTYAYDESAYSPGGAVRGHLTTVSKSLNMTSGPAPTTHTGWNTSDPGLGDKAYVIDARGNTTTYAYDGSGGCSGSLITSTTNSINQTVSGAYDCNTGLLTSLTDANGNTTSVTWDAMRRIQQVTYPAISAGTPTTTFTYADSANTVTRTVLATPGQTQTTQVVFDAFGREVNRYTTDAVGQAEVDTTYDGDGRVYSVTNPYRSGDTIYDTTTSYDALGRKLTVTEPDGSTVTTQYTGPTVDSWDENNTHMQHTSDALGRLVTVKELGTPSDPRSLETDYTYNPLGDLLSVNQQGAAGETPRTRSFTYDSLSRLITSQNPETGTICYGQWNGGSCTGGYDPNGNLLYKTDANNTVLGFQYDALNRLTSRNASDGSVSDVFVYDTAPPLYGGTPFTCTNGIGRLCQADHPSYSGTAFNYDPMGRVTSTLYASQTNAQAYATAMSAVYDLAGNPTQLTYPDGRIVTQTFDAAGHLSNVLSGGVNYISGLTYTAAGAEAGFTLGNGVTQSTSFNSRLQPVRSIASTPVLAAGTSGAGNLLDRQAYYSPTMSLGGGSPGGSGSGSTGNNGNIFAITDNLNVGWSQSFGYDGLNRLNSAIRSDGGYNHTYNYDSFGNMIVQDNLHAAQSFAIDPLRNQLLRNPIAGGSVLDSYGHPANSYEYDYAGNLVADAVAGHTYTYNALNQVVSVDNDATANYGYNGSDERAYKWTTGGNWTNYLYLNGQPMAEQTSDGTWTDYIYANGQKIAKVDSQKPLLHLHGVRNNNWQCGTEGAVNGTSPGLAGMVVAAGDQLVFDFQQTQPSYGGLALIFTDNTGTGAATDSGGTGQPLYFDGESDGAWHHMVGDMSQFAGETVSYALAGIHHNMPDGAFDLYYANAGVLHSNGSMTPIFTGQSASVDNFSGDSCGATQMSSSTDITPITDPGIATSYYLDDHLGTTQMELSGGGWPLWQGQFTPFGMELDTQQTSMHYKFTGKERDAETGLDFFGARYYSSSVGRWMSPDWSAKEEPVPYAKLDNPQSLNLYSYVGNNPLSNIDPDGHACTAWYGNSGWTGSSGFCDRAAEYRRFDANPAINSRTRFFGAAAIVSNSLGDVDAWRVIVRPLGVSSQTGSILEGIGRTLQAFNEGESHLVATGALGSGPALDSQLVHNEQGVVQGVLNGLQTSDLAGYNKAIGEINGSLNGLATRALEEIAPSDRAYAGILAGVRKDLGRDINFANQSDREAIGNAQVQALRKQQQ